MIGRVRYCLGLAILTLALPGCLLLRQPAPLPPSDGIVEYVDFHDDGRAGVYIFFVNGNDPFGLANLKGVRDYFCKLGYPRTYFGGIAHECWMAEELVCIHRDHPGSRFIVVGFDYGADAARNIAQAGLNRGATIDMLLFLEPKGRVFNAPAADSGIVRTVVVQGKSLLQQSAPIAGAEIITVASKHRYQVPTRPEVIELLESEAALSAALVPIVVFAPEPIPALLDETAPSPRPVSERKDTSYDEWDFLKLISRRSSPNVLDSDRAVRGNIRERKVEKPARSIVNPYNASRVSAAQPRILPENANR
jgi:hypothetical protein